MSFTPASGNAGRVKIGGSAVAGLDGWDRDSKTNTIPIPHFESGANADGLIQPNKLRGLGDGGTVTLSGLVDLAAGGTHALLENGKYVTVDLVNDKTTGKGYPAVPGWISSFKLGAKVGNEAQKFTATLDVDGVFPEFGTVS